VIGGELRGRRLHVPAGSTVRPTTDRVREAVFDILYSLGGVDGRLVADLFCGTGAMGIEALSRGAAAVTFVDRDAGAIAAVRENLVAVGLADAERTGDVTCTRAEVEDWAAVTKARYDLVLCDPPYDFQGWELLVSRLPADLAVLESRERVELPAGWGVLKSKRYGGTIVTVARSGRVAEKGRS
jgi:16S rRNA (guanine966-N2)-methyltransferase